MTLSAREQASVSYFARLLEYQMLSSKSDGPVHPSELLCPLDQYHSLISPLMSSEPTDAVLRHPDLRPFNVLLDSNSKKIIIIGWQGMDALPVLLRTGFPSLADNGGREASNSLAEAQIPNYANMDEVEKGDAKVEYFRSLAHYYYFLATGKWNPNPFGKCYKVHLSHVRAALAYEMEILFYFMPPCSKSANCGLRWALSCHT